MGVTPIDQKIPGQNIPDICCYCPYISILSLIIICSADVSYGNQAPGLMHIVPNSISFPTHVKSIVNFNIVFCPFFSLLPQNSLMDLIRQDFFYKIGMFRENSSNLLYISGNENSIILI